MKRLVAMLLILCLCGAILASCGNNGGEDDPTAAPGTEEQTPGNETTGSGAPDDTGKTPGETTGGNEPGKTPGETTGGNEPGKTPGVDGEGVGEVMDWEDGVISKISEYDLTSEVRFFGRTYSYNGAYYMNWSASGFEFSFQGSRAEATMVSENIGSTTVAYLKVTVDGIPVKKIPLRKATQNIVIASGLKPNETHVVRVEMVSNNGKCATAGLKSLRLTDGEKLPAPKAPEGLKMEIIGDSISVGYGVLGKGEKDGKEQESWSSALDDATLSYAALAARALGMEYHVTAASGRGIYKNGDKSMTGRIPDIYTQVDGYHYNTSAWDFSSWQPDVIVINLGTNDEYGGLKAGDPNFRTACEEFLKTIREKNPNAYIIYAYGQMRQAFAEDIQAIIASMQKEGDNKIEFLAMAPNAADGSEWGISHHPSVAGSISRADVLISKLREIFGAKATVQTPVADIVAADRAVKVDESLAAH